MRFSLSLRRFSPGRTKQTNARFFVLQRTVMKRCRQKKKTRRAATLIDELKLREKLKYTISEEYHNHEEHVRVAQT